MSLWQHIIKSQPSVWCCPSATVQRCWEPPAGAALVFNCQMGRGRTTTGMIIASLLHLRKALRTLAPPPVPVEGLPAWFYSAEGVTSPRKAGLSVLEETELKAGGWWGGGVCVGCVCGGGLKADSRSPLLHIVHEQQGQGLRRVIAAFLGSHLNPMGAAECATRMIASLTGFAGRLTNRHLSIGDPHCLPCRQVCGHSQPVAGVGGGLHRQGRAGQGGRRLLGHAGGGLHAVVLCVVRMTDKRWSMKRATSQALP